MSDIVSISGLRFSYGDRPVLDRLDLRIPEGLTMGIVGPNGCGKSTLLKLLCGLLEPAKGDICIAGKPLRGMPHKQRAKLVALLPQDTPAATMRVGDLVLNGRIAHQGFLQLASTEDRCICEKAMELAGVRELAKRPVRALSGGQRQRAYIAMVLAQKPRVMLLDEPTSALDIGASHEIMKLICAVREEQSATVVAVLHDLELALRYCDRIVVMDNGGVAVDGTSDAMVESGVLERVFDVRVHPHDTPFGRAWSFFPG